MTVAIATATEDSTVLFAASELARYLSRMLSQDVYVMATSSVEPGPTITLTIDEGLTPTANTRPPLEDVIEIDVRRGRGRIAGNSARSVLLAVYRFLGAQGCRWVRPGAAGEVVPTLRALVDVQRHERPTHRHRILCVEGAFRYEHLREMIDWAPKAGFNGFFIQFRDAYPFFDRWYRDPRRAARRSRLPRGTAAALARRAESEILRRGLVLHTVGHGWGCESIGIAGLGWDYAPATIPEAATPLLAQVGGVRKLFGGVPINTNLCYSNPEVHRRFVGEVVDYAGRHPEVDVLQVWLADNANNHCECAGCTDIRPADAYVALLDDVAQAMTDRGLSQRIVCIAYQDLLWPPTTERLRDPGRFLFAFAPVSRSYGRPFRPNPDATEAMRPYRRNAIDLPRTADDHAGYLAEWRRQLPTEAVMFEYHLWRNQYTDPGSLRTARLLSDDLKALGAMGFVGFASCQPMRSSFPTGLSMAVLAATLWDDAVAFDDIVASSLEAAFGKDWQAAHAYLVAVSDRFYPGYLRGEPVDLSLVQAGASELPAIAEAAMREFEEQAGAATHPVHRRSWELLAHHAWLMHGLAGIVSLRLSGQVDAGIAAFRDFESEIDDRADRFGDALDSWMLKTSLADALASASEPPVSWI